MKKIIITLVLLAQQHLYAGAEIGNEVIGEDGRPISTSTPICDLKTTGAEYLSVLEDKKVPIEDSLEFVKMIYSPLYYQILSALEKVNVCETKQDIAPQLFPHEYKEKRVSLWVRNGDISRDLILIDVRKYYSNAPTPADQSFTFIRELLHPVLRDKYRHDEAASEWINRNLTYAFAQAYTKFIKGNLSKDEVISIRKSIDNYKLLKLDNLFSEECRTTSRCKELRNSSEGLFNFTEVFNYIYFNQYVLNTSPEYFDFALGMLEDSTIERIKKYSNLIRIRSYNDLVDYISVFNKYNVLSTFSDNITTALKEVSLIDREGNSQLTITDYFRTLDLAKANHIALPSKDEILSILIPGYFINSTSMKRYINDDLIPQFSFLETRGFQSDELVNRFTVKNITSHIYYPGNTYYMDFYESVDSSIKLLEYKDDWSTEVQAFEKIRKGYREKGNEKSALRWGYLIKLDLITKDKLDNKSRKYLIKLLKRFDSTKDYAEKLQK